MTARAKLAIVLGRHENVWKELAEALRDYEPDTFICVNRIGQHYAGVIHHWVSFHPELFPLWLKVRRQAGFPEPGKFWSANFKGNRLGRKVIGIPLNWVPSLGGSSGLLGVQVALEVADKAILCGIPMENSAQYDTGKPWDEAAKHRAAWTKYLPQLEGRVRSLSRGWTRDVLGAPTKEWAGVKELAGDG